MLAGEVQPPQVYYADAAVLLQELGAALKAVYPAAVGLTVTSGFVSVLSAFPLYQKKLREMRSGVMPPRYPEGRHRLEMQYSGAATCDYVGVQVLPSSCSTTTAPDLTLPAATAWACSSPPPSSPP